ncbi:hypothetical protein [uncultured Chryseobacterium sp.]|uniref:hypothetical protein n=1 Tax=uncultured Chryseobacterium sp. TaxID=259322 RepID=UPI002584FD11|nr:hypothetical protein [uncultured Chryseobacterium sp.]
MYKVGLYTISPEEPFSSLEQAVEYIQKIYPELDKESIKNHLTPKIETNGKDKSGDVSEENSVSNQDDSEAGTTGVKRIKSTSNKPG